MKNIMIVLLLVGSILGQDRLIIKSGQEFPGTYKGATDDEIHFIQEGKTEAVSIEKSKISKVILEDGTVIFDQGTTQEPAQSDQTQPIAETDTNIETGVEPISETARDYKPGVVTDNDYERRQTEALEKIAISTTGIYYLMAASTAVAILAYIKYLDEMKILEKAYP